MNHSHLWLSLLLYLDFSAGIAWKCDALAQLTCPFVALRRASFLVLSRYIASQKGLWDFPSSQGRLYLQHHTVIYKHEEQCYLLVCYLGSLEKSRKLCLWPRLLHQQPRDWLQRYFIIWVDSYSNERTFLTTQGGGEQQTTNQTGASIISLWHLLHLNIILLRLRLFSHRVFNWTAFPTNSAPTTCMFLHVDTVAANHSNLGTQVSGCDICPLFVKSNARKWWDKFWFWGCGFFGLVWVWFGFGLVFAWCKDFYGLSKKKKNPHSIDGDKAKQLPSIPQFQINSG